MIRSSHGLYCSWHLSSPTASWRIGLSLTQTIWMKNTAIKRRRVSKRDIRIFLMTANILLPKQALPLTDSAIMIMILMKQLPLFECNKSQLKPKTTDYISWCWCWTCQTNGRARCLQHWFRNVSNYDHRPTHLCPTSVEEEHDEKHKLGFNNRGEATGLTRRRLARYKVHRTQYTKVGSTGEERTMISSIPCCRVIIHIIKQFISILRMRNTWKVLVFSFASVPVAMQWTASEMSLPPFLERRFGESIPIYTIQSIHMVGCLIFPPFAQAFTSALEDFRVVMPGVRNLISSERTCHVLLWIYDTNLFNLHYDSCGSWQSRLCF